MNIKTVSELAFIKPPHIHSNTSSNLHFSSLHTVNLLVAYFIFSLEKWVHKQNASLLSNAMTK